MTDLIFLTIPFLGRVYAQRDTITVPQLSIQQLHAPCGKEWLLCWGSLRVYLTLEDSLAAERR